MFIYRFHHRLFFFFNCFLLWGNVLVRFTVSSVCCTSFWSIQEHFANSQVRIYHCTLCQLQKDFDCGICYRHGKPQNEFEAQCMLCIRTLKFGTFGVKALVSHTKLGKNKQTRTLRCLCHLAVRSNSNHLQLSFNVESGGALDFVCVCVSVSVYNNTRVIIANETEWNS